MVWIPTRAIIVTAMAVAYGFLNGLHDSGNIGATAIASGVLSWRKALLLGSVAVFVAPFLFGVEVARTVGVGIVDPGTINIEVIIASLVGAGLWNLFTWYLGLPSSSSHALLGGILGSVIIAAGPTAIKLSGILKALGALLLAPPLGLIGGYVVMKVTLFLASAASPRVNVWFKRGQILTVLALALGHGTNDAQMSMGIVTLALVTSGVQSHFAVPNWVVLASAAAMALGTAVGGGRIIKTLGSRLYRIRPIHGFTAQLASAAVILPATILGGPVSSSQVVSSAIMGAGSAERVSKVRWGAGRSMLVAWLLTIPAAGLIAAGAYALITVIW